MRRVPAVAASYEYEFLKKGLKMKQLPWIAAFAVLLAACGSETQTEQAAADDADADLLGGVGGGSQADTLGGGRGQRRRAHRSLTEKLSSGRHRWR